MLTLLLLAATAANPACTPECRDGFICIEGECVSACNPGCADGERCTTARGAAECVAAAAPGSAPRPTVEGTEAADGIGLCTPACAPDEKCLRVSAGYRCLSSKPQYAPPNSKRAPQPRYTRQTYRDSVDQTSPPNPEDVF